MRIPPIEWEDLYGLGVSRGATVEGSESVTIAPAPSKHCRRLVSMLAASQPPDPTIDRLGYVRAIRDAAIACSDWTQMPDSPLTDEKRAAWAAYRQAMRDLPDNYVAPGPIPWPQEPA